MSTSVFPAGDLNPGRMPLLRRHSDFLNRLRASALLALAFLAPWAYGQSNYATPYFFQTLAGGLARGTTDGTGEAAKFNSPQGLAVDGSGILYVADTLNSTIRKIAPYGVVTTLAGSAGNPGFADGTGSAARFRSPSGVAVDTSGNVYVADTGNNTIRKITPAGAVTTIAGFPTISGSEDGIGSAARLNAPFGIAADSSGTVYFSDLNNHTLRRISPAGIVTTLAGSAGNPANLDGAGPAARFSSPLGVAVDRSGNVYVADQANTSVRKITPAGVVTTLAGLAGAGGDLDGTGAAARFHGPQGITVDAAGNVFVADTASTIRKITPGGVVTTLAGKTNTIGNLNATGSMALFGIPYGLAVDGSGNLYVADTGNHAIRVGVYPLDQSNYATPYYFTTLTTGRFNPGLLAVDSVGVVYVAGHGNHVIYKITPFGGVTVLAGSFDVADSTDGTGNGAQFNSPFGTAVDGSGNVYVADTENNTIRKITAAGVVTTLAGSALAPAGSADGAGATARFNKPYGIAVDPTGNVYVADTENHTVRKITANGVVTTLAGLAGSAGTLDGTGSGARFKTPGGIAVDENGNLYVSDVGNYTIRKITSNGVVTTLAGRAGNPGSRDGPAATARFGWPVGVAVDRSGDVFVADWLPYSTIRKISQGVVTTLAGLTGEVSTTPVDGRGSEVRFGGPFGIAVDGNGNLYVSDQPGSIRMSVFPPTFTTQPANQTVPAGGTAVFTSNVTSNVAVTYQWRKDGAPIPGATAATLSVANAQSANLGAYMVVVTNVAGSTTSSAAVLSLSAGPGFTTQPSSQTVLAGSTVTFTAVVNGTPPISYQWLKDGASIAGATNVTLTANNVQASNVGNYTLVATNAAGSSVSNAAALALVLAPAFTTQPANQSAAPGGAVIFTAAVGGTPPFSYQWLKDGIPIPGATNAMLTVNNVQASNLGNYTVVITNAAGTITSNVASLEFAVSGRLVNLSIRSNAGTGAQTLIVGFVVGGAGTSGAKPLLIRAAGPALGFFGVSGTLTDPSLSVFSGATLVAGNDNWNGDAQIIAIGSQVGAFAFTSTSSRDAALFASGLGSGAYTVQITGVGNTTGIALAEIYDATAAATFTSATPRLVNVSARTQVGTGADILIAGFAIGGSTSKALLIRAVGPTLGAFGVGGALADPRLDLFSGSTLLQANDNWGGAPAIATVAASVGAFALDAASRDAVLLVTLPPGSYTAQVSGVGNTTGIALVEIYEVP